MAKDVSTDVWKFDATTQYDGAGGGSSPANNFAPFVKTVVFVDDGTNHGQFKVLTKASGAVVAEGRTTSSVNTIVIPVNLPVAGVYIQALPTNGLVYVYVGRR